MSDFNRGLSTPDYDLVAEFNQDPGIDLVGFDPQVYKPNSPPNRSPPNPDGSESSGPPVNVMVKGDAVTDVQISADNPIASRALLSQKQGVLDSLQSAREFKLNLESKSSGTSMLQHVIRAVADSRVFEVLDFREQGRPWPLPPCCGFCQEIVWNQPENPKKCCKICEGLGWRLIYEPNPLDDMTEEIANLPKRTNRPSVKKVPTPADPKRYVFSNPEPYNASSVCCNRCMAQSPLFDYSANRATPTNNPTRKPPTPAMVPG